MVIPHLSARHDPNRCMTCAVGFTRVNLAVNLTLAVLKALVAVLAGSRALLAGALYSLNDVLSAIVVMLTLGVGKAPPDEEHPYGHEKVELIGVAVVALTLVLAVSYIFYYAVRDLLKGVESPPHLIAFLVASLTLLTNLFLYKKGECAAEHCKSLALHTSAEHNRADAVSSIAVLIAVGGATLGWHFLDPLVAVYETVDVLRLSGSLLRRSIGGLMDASLPPGDVDEITRVCAAVPGVRLVEGVRARKVGAVCWVDVDIAVDPGLPVSEAHEISEAVRRALRATVGSSVEAQVKFRAGGYSSPRVAVLEEPQHA